LREPLEKTLTPEPPQLGIKRLAVRAGMQPGEDLIRFQETARFARKSPELVLFVIKERKKEQIV
jgi:hypothetical protein